MGSFVEDLWRSVFTPGPTPTLLLATNVTFAALQSVLFALLVATFSVHFFVLSALSAALWASINWFAKEVAEVQKKAAENEKENREGSSLQADKGTPRALDGTESETETESLSLGRKENITHSAGGRDGSSALRPGHGEGVGDDELRKRVTAAAGDTSSSTDSEWEKVDEGVSS